MSAPEHRSRALRYQYFLDVGAIGFMAASPEEWAAAAWIAPPKLRGFPTHVPRNISSKFPWLFEAHTNAPYRGQGLHKALVIERLHYLAERGAGEALAASDVNPANTPSLRSMSALGFEPAGILDVWTPHVRPVPEVPVGLWRRKAAHPSGAGANAAKGHL